MVDTPDKKPEAAPSPQAEGQAQGQAGGNVTIPAGLVQMLLTLAIKRPDILQRLAQMYVAHAAQAQQQAPAEAPSPGQKT